MTNALVPYPGQGCQGFSFAPAGWYSGLAVAWPLFPAWTGNGTIRPTLQLAWRPGEQPGDEFEWWLPGDPRGWVTYYRPLPADFGVSASLFPGQGHAPPWSVVYEELAHLWPREVYRLRCIDALRLFGRVVSYQQWRQQQQQQHDLHYLTSTWLQTQKSHEQVLTVLAGAVCAALQQQRSAATAQPADSPACTATEAAQPANSPACTATVALPTSSEAVTDNQRATAAKRRRRRSDKVRPLTLRQTQVLAAVGECNGNLAAAARQLGVDRKTVAQHYEACLRKLGREAVRHATRRLPTDRRGQLNVCPEDDRRRGI